MKLYIKINFWVHRKKRTLEGPDLPTFVLGTLRCDVKVFKYFGKWLE